jgi:hypothetical protein
MTHDEKGLDDHCGIPRTRLDRGGDVRLDEGDACREIGSGQDDTGRRRP